MHQPLHRLHEPLLIHAHEVASQPWRNGGGLTRELLVWPAQAPQWQLRLSLAEVRRDGPFSPYPGVERWFAVIDGAGVRLRIGAQEHRLEPGHEPLCFDGSLPATCALIDGATIDLNLMHTGGRARMSRAQSSLAWRSPLPQRGLFTRCAGLWRRESTPPLRLPAHTLLWLEHADDGSWDFIADRPELPVPALWLEFAPEVQRTGLDDTDTRV